MLTPPPSQGEAVEYTHDNSEDGRAKAMNVTGPSGADVLGAPRRQYAGRRERAAAPEGAEGAAVEGSEGAAPGAGRGRGRGGRGGRGGRPRRPRPAGDAAAPAPVAA